ncbi:MAG: DUF86 domain-containing protein [Anaerolineae bacterium]|nr:DUF86 domain-containing protein [Anaerolineae bacterium]
MNDRDKVRLRDMLDAAHDGAAFATGRTRHMLDTDRMFAFALVRAIEIIGEAASRLSPETRQGLPQIQWQAVIGMRNKIIHDYVSVDYNIVWDVATNDLPNLIGELEKILGDSEQSDPPA